MIELKDYQKSAVKQLKERIMDMLGWDGMRHKLVFKAPTGSGKTVMTSALLDELKRDLEMKFMDCAYIWIAPNKLHIQSYMSFRNFFSETRSLRPVMFDEADPAEGLKPGQVLFLNWESINKENAILIRDNEQNRNLAQLTRRTQQNGLPIIVVIDEEHMFGGKNAKKSELVLQNIQPKIELRVSATPITGGCPLIEVPRHKVIAEEMIKKGIELNPQLKGSNEIKMDEQLLEQALERRNNLARAYREFDINPLLLIQLPNDSKDSLDTEEKTLVKEIEQFLDVNKDINVSNGKLAVWLSDRHENLHDIEKSNNMVEVLLFKQAIALGWDCPRASVLLIYRDIKSMTFTAQTVGRILRMPQQQHYQNEALNYGYVYTNLSADKVEIVKDDMNYISTLYAKKREDARRIELNSVYQDRRKTPHVLMSPFKEYFKRVVAQEWDLPQTELFGADGGWDDLGEDEKSEEETDYTFSENKRKANKHGIRTDVGRIMVKIPKDLLITGEVGQTNIEDIARFARTQDELLISFYQFCRKNVGDYEPGQSSEMIRSAIYEFFEDYLGMPQNDAIKVVLYHLNKPKFAAYLAKAEARYAEEYEKREQERNPEVYVPFKWELPDTRMYNSEVSHHCEDIYHHALLPFFEENRVSEPEFKFSRMLDKNNEVIDWWYKNADSGHMHFAVPYTDKDGVPRCFYVDYIIRLKNGTVCLFDTKSKDSDPNAPMKHNALLDYMQHENEKNHKRLIGGVIIEQNDNWYYSPMKIENTSDLKGWDALDLASINVEP